LGSPQSGIPNVANNLNRKGHIERKELLVCLLLCRGFVFYALYVVEAALHLELLAHNVKFRVIAACGEVLFVPQLPFVEACLLYPSASGLRRG
jgi:hypothetical protein